MDSDEINYLLLPEGLRAGLRRYVEHGVLPGDFLRAVIKNDLAEATLRADEINLAMMRNIVLFMHAEVPSTCWGSQERMDAWVKAHADFLAAGQRRSSGDGLDGGVPPLAPNAEDDTDSPGSQGESLMNRDE